MHIEPVTVYIIEAIIITLLVLLVSALNTVLIATALFNNWSAKQRNSKRVTRRSEGRNNRAAK